LRLRWEITDLTATVLETARAWTKLSGAEQADFAGRLDALVGTVWSSEKELATAVGLIPSAIHTEFWKAVAVSHAEGALQVRRGQPIPDPDLRDQENVPLPSGTPEWDQEDVGAAKRLTSLAHQDAVESYVTAEVLPWIPGAWVDHSKTRIGYEIPMTRHFYKYVPPRPVAEIDAEIKQLEAEIRALVDEVTE
jgi:type I restriction enzyme M protein